jgi:hypothetical protein
MNKQIVIGALAVAAIGSGLFATQAFAQNEAMPEDTLIQKISDTFKLNKGDVEKVFIAHHSEKKAEMEKRFGERLDQAVKNGDLTESQKTLILNKRKELASEMEKHKESLKNMTPEERKSTMQKHHAEIEAWAKQNNIDLKWLGFKMKLRFGPKN